MKTISLPGAALALLCALGPRAALADNYCRDACTATIQQGIALEGQDKYQEALEKFRAAAKADPLASLPVSMEAGLYLSLSERVPPEKAEELRGAARATANRALRLAPEDPVAQEVLRRLDDDGPSPLHAPNAQAHKLMDAAETQFMQQHYDDALRDYEAAAQADPQYSGAWVGAGDSYFARKDWANAEALFRRAVAMEPANSQGWRYLADALAMQGKREEAGKALYAAVAADPSQRPNWGKLAMARRGPPLESLGLRRGVHVTQGADGKFTVNVDKSVADDAAPPDLALRIALAASEANQRAEDKAHAKPPYDIELQAWRTAIQAVDEAQAKTGDGLRDPALRRMQAFAHDGQLEPAILLLQFRQSYRPALNAWLAAHPDGIKTFVDRYGVQP